MLHVMEVVGRYVGAHTCDELFKGAQARGLTWVPIYAPEELLDDPHMKARVFFQTVEHPELGKSFTYPGPPYLFSRTPWRLTRRAPLVGEHNAEIYIEEMGLSKGELISLAAAGVI
jgi:crotonobetainyl-CoA:carnitine CoA-transferase CaiB-like acyl-CoA transferase